MSAYTESTVTGHAWRRCNQIVIDNRRGSTPTVRFDEEAVVALAGAAEVRTPAGVLPRRLSITIWLHRRQAWPVTVDSV